VPWNSDPALGILVAEAWIPYVSGAMKVLLQDAVWDGGGTSVFPTLQDMNDLIASWRPLFEIGPEAGWYMACVCQGSPPLIGRQVSGIPGILGDYGWHSGTFYAEQNSTSLAAMDMHITFKANDDDSPVGVNIYDFECAASFPTHVLNVVATSCLGTIYPVVAAGSVNYVDLFATLLPVALKSIDIYCDTDAIEAFMKGADPIQCTVA